MENLVGLSYYMDGKELKLKASKPTMELVPKPKKGKKKKGTY